MTNTARDVATQDLRESGDVFDLENHTEADVPRVLNVIGEKRVARWLGSHTCVTCRHNETGGEEFCRVCQQLTTWFDHWEPTDKEEE